MLKRKVFTIGVSILGCLFLLAFGFSDRLVNDSKTKFVALSDEAMEHVKGGLDPRNLQTSSGSLAICPFLNVCDPTRYTKKYTYGKCVSCSYSGQRKFGGVNGKRIETQSWCNPFSATQCVYFAVHAKSRSCEIYTTATCT